MTAPAASAADPRTWHLRNSNSLGVADVSVGYGDTSQTPIVGDWNADGKDTPGMVRPSTWWLSNTLTGTTAQFFAYGSTGMVPIPGDWDGNGTSTVGMRQGLRWLLANVNGNVTASIDFNLGNPSGDVPLSGDWNGDGKDTPGVYRRSNHTFYLAGGLSSTCCVASVSYGIVGDIPLVGDWNGDGKDTIGVYRVDGFGAHWQLNNANDASAPDYDFVYGSPGDVPVTGDWNGDGTDTVGVVRTGTSPPDPYPTSTRFGGANQAIDASGEYDAFFNSLDGLTDAEIVHSWAGVSPADQANLNDYLDLDEWAPADVDEDDLSVDTETELADDPADETTGPFVSRSREEVRSADGTLVDATDVTTVDPTVAEAPDRDIQDDRAAADRVYGNCPSNYVNRKSKRIFRFHRKPPLREFQNPAIRYHLQINSKFVHRPFVQSSYVTTIFRHPDDGRRIKNENVRPQPGKPAYYSHTNSHVKPGTVFRYDAGITFIGKGIVTKVIVLSNGTTITTYLKYTGIEGACRAG